MNNYRFTPPNRVHTLRSFSFDRNQIGSNTKCSRKPICHSLNMRSDARLFRDHDDVNIANNRRAVGSMDRDIEAVAEMGCADVRTSTLHAIVTSWERGRVDPALFGGI